MSGETLKPIILNPPLNPTLITDGAGLEKVKNFLANSKDKIIGWDKETPPVKDYFWRKDRTWQIGNLNEQYVVDLLAFVDGNSDALYSAQGYYGLKLDKRLQIVLDTFYPALCTKEFLKVGVNLPFEYEQSYWGFGMRTWNFFSCDYAERVIQAGAHSLKDYAYFSMEQMMARYFGLKVDKDLQLSFTLDQPLTDAQVYYAALDTRLPLALRLAQLRILQKDGLLETAKIENDALGSFVDMHVHGQRLNTEKWIERDTKLRSELKTAIEGLDSHFLPLVGNKSEIITDQELEQLQQAWKAKNKITDEELTLKKLIKNEKDIQHKAALTAKLQLVELERKEEKERLKKIHGDRKKKRTAINKLVTKCEGEALINYGSNAQLYDILIGLKGLKDLKDTNDDTLANYNDIPIIAAIQKYRKFSKQVDTYGLQWTKQWTTHPCAEEGWLHPGDNRLHADYNQLDAATGRSTSSSPNGQNIPQDPELRSCFICDPPDEKEPDGYAIITADMSGAELRIIAELADSPTWIGAFARGEDVHSVGTELLYPEKWPSLTIPSIESPNGWLVGTKERITIVVNGKEKKIPPCMYYAIKSNGEIARQKCDCPEHKKLRDGNKSTNFLLAYGGTDFTLAQRIGVSRDEARELMHLHEQKNPEVWAYLDRSGKEAKFKGESRDMFGRRRLFPKPTWELAKQEIIDVAQSEEDSRWEKCLRKDFGQGKSEKKWEAIVDQIKQKFEEANKRKPKKDELYQLTHNPNPEPKYISSMMQAMYGRIERQGKNHAIQGTNASIIKLAMGCGYSPKGMPYLWHTLPLVGAKILSLIHDELVIQAPKRNAEKVAKMIGIAFKVAAAEKMKKVVMEFDYHIAEYWKK